MSDITNNPVEPTETTMQPQDNEGLLVVQGLIQSLADQADQAKAQKKEIQEMLKNLLIHDDELDRLDQEAKKAATEVKKRRAVLLQTQEATELKAKISELNEEVKDLEDSISNHLLSYYEQVGVKVLDLPDGGEREFKITAKLLGLGSKKAA